MLVAAKPVKKKTVANPKPVQETIVAVASDSDASPLPVARRAARQTRKVQTYVEIEDDDDDDNNNKNGRDDDDDDDDVFMASGNDSDF